MRGSILLLGGLWAAACTSPRPAALEPAAGSAAPVEVAAKDVPVSGHREAADRSTAPYPVEAAAGDGGEATAPGSVEVSATTAAATGSSSAPTPGAGPSAIEAAEGAPDPEKPEEDPLGAFRKKTPRCPPRVAYCFDVVLHLTHDGGAPVVPVAWVAAQIRTAHELFAPVDVAFQIAQARALPPEIVEIETRSERDALGRERFSRGVVHVFVVARLADVDIAGEEIRGVHWRLRGERKRRWIILSKIASERVLSHELGHFFGLPHSTHTISIMNKTPRTEPPWSERRFADPELPRMRRHRDLMLRSGMLVDRAGERR